MDNTKTYEKMHFYKIKIRKGTFKELGPVVFISNEIYIKEDIIEFKIKLKRILAEAGYVNLHSIYGFAEELREKAEFAIVIDDDVFYIDVEESNYAFIEEYGIQQAFEFFKKNALDKILSLEVRFPYAKYENGHIYIKSDIGWTLLK